MTTCCHQRVTRRFRTKLAISTSEVVTADKAKMLRHILNTTAAKLELQLGMAKHMMHLLQTNTTLSYVNTDRNRGFNSALSNSTLFVDLKAGLARNQQARKVAELSAVQSERRTVRSAAIQAVALALRAEEAELWCKGDCIEISGPLLPLGAVEVDLSCRTVGDALERRHRDAHAVRQLGRLQSVGLHSRRKVLHPESCANKNW